MTEQSNWQASKNFSSYKKTWNYYKTSSKNKRPTSVLLNDCEHKSKSFLHAAESISYWKLFFSKTKIIFSEIIYFHILEKKIKIKRDTFFTYEKTISICCHHPLNFIKKQEKNKFIVYNTSRCSNEKWTESSALKTNKQNIYLICLLWYSYIYCTMEDYWWLNWIKSFVLFHLFVVHPEYHCHHHHHHHHPVEYMSIFLLQKSL